MGAAHHARGQAETPRGDTVNHDVDEASVRQSYACVSCGWRCSGARARRARVQLSNAGDRIRFAVPVSKFCNSKNC
jgi:hypothetical protein